MTYLAPFLKFLLRFFASRLKNMDTERLPLPEIPNTPSADIFIFNAQMVFIFSTFFLYIVHHLSCNSNHYAETSSIMPITFKDLIGILGLCVGVGQEPLTLRLKAPVSGSEADDEQPLPGHHPC